MARLTLAERETVLSQSAQDRRDGIWHVYSNDPYQIRRLTRADATLVEEKEGARWYTVLNRQVLIRKVPASRKGQSSARVIEFLARRRDKVNRKAVEIRAEDVPEQ